MPQPYPQHICDRARRLAEVHDGKTVAEIMGISRNTVIRMRKRNWTAAVPCPFRPMPSDFAIQVRHMGYDDLEKHYRTSTATIARWKRELGLPMVVRRQHESKQRDWKASRTTHPFRQRPTDYAIQRKYMTIDEAAAHYKTSTRAIVRWDREFRG